MSYKKLKETINKLYSRFGCQTDYQKQKLRCRVFDCVKRDKKHYGVDDQTYKMLERSLKCDKTLRLAPTTFVGVTSLCMYDDVSYMLIDALSCSNDLDDIIEYHLGIACEV